MLLVGRKSHSFGLRTVLYEQKGKAIRLVEALCIQVLRSRSSFTLFCQLMCCKLQVKVPDDDTATRACSISMWTVLHVLLHLIWQRSSPPAFQCPIVAGMLAAQAACVSADWTRLIWSVENPLPGTLRVWQIEHMQNLPVFVENFNLFSRLEKWCEILAPPCVNSASVHTLVSFFTMLSQHHVMWDAKAPRWKPTKPTKRTRTPSASHPTWPHMATPLSPTMASHGKPKHRHVHSDNVFWHVLKLCSQRRHEQNWRKTRTKSTSKCWPTSQKVMCLNPSSITEAVHGCLGWSLGFCLTGQFLIEEGLKPEDAQTNVWQCRKMMENHSSSDPMVAPERSPQHWSTWVPLRPGKTSMMTSAMHPKSEQTVWFKLRRWTNCLRLAILLFSWHFAYLACARRNMFCLQTSGKISNTWPNPSCCSVVWSIHTHFECDQLTKCNMKKIEKSSLSPGLSVIKWIFSLFFLLSGEFLPHVENAMRSGATTVVPGQKAVHFPQQGGRGHFQLPNLWSSQESGQSGGSVGSLSLFPDECISWNKLN